MLTFVMFIVWLWWVLHCPFPLSGLDEFLKRLDSRYEEKVKKEGMLMAKQNRSQLSLASVPPPIAPNWTINPEWNIGL